MFKKVENKVDLIKLEENILDTELYLILQAQVEIVVNPDLVSPQPQEISKSLCGLEVSI